MLCTPAHERSREEINTEIRDFLATRQDHALTRNERRVYEQLLTEWLAAPQPRRPHRSMT
ncbi:hypothetical protein QZH56_34595 [Streptomyces olivoreticuli]|uniref:Uncharacterized protein n=1 Tax=Streptomyces blastmyceticus TaxID=68180 RepID=A0ABP3GLS7_9ACTN|nr:hypothetical protein [Streptomyces olivoreticuli]WKK23765.1 hypothetical protein QZH56_34595 [Streptomyces olivoreticuli]